MKKTLILPCCIVLAVMLAVSPASAGTINLTFNIADGNTYASVYTYPYYFTINGSNNGGLGWALMCMDYYNEIGKGESWSATYSLVVNSNDLSQERAAWIFLQGVNGFNGETGSQAAIDANVALWRFDDGGAAPASTTGADWLLGNLPATFAPGYFNGVVEYDPVQGGPQRFFGYNTPVPEPGTLLMLGTGVIGLARVLRRKMTA